MSNNFLVTNHSYDKSIAFYGSKKPYRELKRIKSFMKGGGHAKPIEYITSCEYKEGEHLLAAISADTVYRECVDLENRLLRLNRHSRYLLTLFIFSASSHGMVEDRCAIIAKPFPFHRR